MKLLTLFALQRQKLTRLFATTQNESTILPNFRKSFFLDVNDRSGRLHKFNLLSHQLTKCETSNDIQLVHFLLNLWKEKFVVYLQTSLQNNLFLKTIKYSIKNLISYYYYYYYYCYCYHMRILQFRFSGLVFSSKT